jgi:hypothetical protein
MCRGRALLPFMKRPGSGKRGAISARYSGLSSVAGPSQEAIAAGWEPTSVRQICAERLTPMWWLSFREGHVVIVTAASLAHARLLAAIAFCHASHFVEGYPISPDLVELIPDHSVGRIISPLGGPAQIGEMGPADAAAGAGARAAPGP